MSPIQSDLLSFLLRICQSRPKSYLLPNSINPTFHNYFIALHICFGQNDVFLQYCIIHFRCWSSLNIVHSMHGTSNWTCSLYAMTGEAKAHRCNSTITIFCVACMDCRGYFLEVPLSLFCVCVKVRVKRLDVIFDFDIMMKRRLILCFFNDEIQVFKSVFKKPKESRQV